MSIILLSNSSWLSPGPPTLLKPPLCLSKCVQDLTNLVFWKLRFANSTCIFPSLDVALKPNISMINCVLSITLTSNIFSKFLCCIGEREQSTTIRSIFSIFKLVLISSIIEWLRKVDNWTI